MKSRRQMLMPRGVPKWVRCYDNGGKTFDRFTVVFTGSYQRNLWKDGKLVEKTGNTNLTVPRPMVHLYVGMSQFPFHPQGFGQHGESEQCCDVNKWGFAPMIGRKNHLGTRIPFKDLPEDCRRLVVSDYVEIWRLK